MNSTIFDLYRQWNEIYNNRLFDKQKDHHSLCQQKELFQCQTRKDWAEIVASKMLLRFFIDFAYLVLNPTWPILNFTQRSSRRTFWLNFRPVTTKVFTPQVWMRVGQILKAHLNGMCSGELISTTIQYLLQTCSYIEYHS